MKHAAAALALGVGLYLAIAHHRTSPAQDDPLGDPLEHLLGAADEFLVGHESPIGQVDVHAAEGDVGQPSRTRQDPADAAFGPVVVGQGLFERTPDLRGDRGRDRPIDEGQAEAVGHGRPDHAATGAEGSRDGDDARAHIK